MKNYNNEQLLSKLYVDEGYTCKNIANMMNVGESTIFRYLRKFGIRRGNQENFSSNVTYKNVENFPAYKVGNDGSVWSCLTNGGKIDEEWHKIKPFGCKSSLMIALRHGGKPYKFLLHRLILTTFIGPCPLGMECCHNDGNAHNNNLSNLRWDTHKNNMLDKHLHGTLAKGEKHGQAKLSDDQVKEIKYLLKLGVSAHRLSRLINVTRRSIMHIANGTNWKHIK